MAVILDIAGNPMPHRKRKNPAREQDLRDLSKILTMLLLIILGFFAFAPEPSDSESPTKVASAQTNAG